MIGAAGQQRVPEDFVRNHKVGVPALSEQRNISAYLDREIMRLDALVSEKNQVLGILAERRRALIIRAVTRGPRSRRATPRLRCPPGSAQSRPTGKRDGSPGCSRSVTSAESPDLPLLAVSINTGVSVREFSDDRIETTASNFNTYKIARRG